MISSKCYEIFGALIGLTGALSNNGKGQDTDALVRKALILAGSPDGDQKKTKEMLAAIRAEKFRISPDCAVCQAPCGNTSDYDPAGFATAECALRDRKDRVMAALCRFAADWSGDLRGEELPVFVYRGISTLAWDFPLKEYDEILTEIEDARSLIL